VSARGAFPDRLAAAGGGLFIDFSLSLSRRVHSLSGRGATGETPGECWQLKATFPVLPHTESESYSLPLSLSLSLCVCVRACVRARVCVCM